MVQVAFTKISLNRSKRIEEDMFKTPLKIVLAASIAIPAFLVANLAQAGQNNKRHHNAHKSYNHQGYNRGHQSYNRGHHGYTRGHHNYYRQRSHYSYSYYPSYYYGGYYGGHYNYRYGHHSNVATYASLALLGATLGLIIHKSSKDRYRNDGYATQQNYAPPPQNQGGDGGFDFSQCRDTRDYETTILVDGQEQLAYGTACLLENGSWIAGPMRIGR